MKFSFFSFILELIILNLTASFLPVKFESNLHLSQPVQFKGVGNYFNFIQDRPDLPKKYQGTRISLSKLQRGRTLNSSPSASPSLQSDFLVEGTFDELFSSEIPQWLRERCLSLGYRFPTLVQERALRLIFQGKDVVLQAQTGSGKTLSYCLPILSQIDPSRAAIQAVIVVPSRELGLQITGVLKQLASGLPGSDRILIMPLVEGSKNRRQQLWAVAEPPHIVVGNPRSLQRIIDQGRLRLSSVSYVVLDEVDACLISAETRRELHGLLSRHLSNSFLSAEDAEAEERFTMPENSVYTDHTKQDRSLSESSYRSNRQTIMCSATIPQRQHFAVQSFKNGWTETIPEVVYLSTAELTPRQIQHEYVQCELPLRTACVRYLIRKEEEQMGMLADGNPNRNVDSSLSSLSSSSSLDGVVVDASEGRALQAIVFVEDPSSAASLYDALSGKLGRKGILSSNTEEDRLMVLDETMGLDERAAVMSALRSGACRVLISTDIAARGIDVPAITHVIQMSLPKHVEGYIHRAGRTGRLGRAGKVITLISPEQGFVVQRFGNEMGVSFRERVLKPKEKL